MDREDIIKLAREAGMQGMLTDVVCTNKELERFAALVAAAERESVAASSKRDLTCVCGAVWDGEQMVHAPRKREWVGLTDEEFRSIVNNAARGGMWAPKPTNIAVAAVHAAAAKLRKKNRGAL